MNAQLSARCLSFSSISILVGILSHATFSVGVTLLCLSSSGNVHATNLVTENFDYPIGANLVGENGGTGFSGPWMRHCSGNVNNKVDDFRPLNANFEPAPQTVWMCCLYSRTLTSGASPTYYGGITTINSTNPDETTPWPAQMQIDYVRVYSATPPPPSEGTAIKY